MDRSVLLVGRLSQTKILATALDALAKAISSPLQVYTVDKICNYKHGLEPFGGLDLIVFFLDPKDSNSFSSIKEGLSQIDVNFLLGRTVCINVSATATVVQQAIDHAEIMDSLLPRGVRYFGCDLNSPGAPANVAKKITCYLDTLAGGSKMHFYEVPTFDNPSKTKSTIFN